MLIENTLQKLLKKYKAVYEGRCFLQYHTWPLKAKVCYWVAHPYRYAKYVYITIRYRKYL